MSDAARSRMIEVLHIIVRDKSDDADRMEHLRDALRRWSSSGQPKLSTVEPKRYQSLIDDILDYPGLTDDEKSRINEQWQHGITVDTISPVKLTDWMKRENAKAQDAFRYRALRKAIGMTEDHPLYQTWSDTFGSNSRLEDMSADERSAEFERCVDAAIAAVGWTAADLENV